MRKKKPTTEPRHVLGGRATAKVFAEKNAKIREKVRAMREDLGLTWDEIGRAIGKAPQTAWAIYNRNVKGKPAA